jgi:hypothetical protein
MRTDMKRLLADTSGVIAAVLLAFSFALGGSQAVRADESESLPLAVEDTVLVPVKDLQALEQRVIYLEETVNALTESWQHIDTHRLCVADDSGAETCLTKPQLDALLVIQAKMTAIDPPPAIVGVESVTVATVPENSEPAPSAVSIAQTDQEPEQTGSITPREPAAELNVVAEPEPAPAAEQP